MSQWVSDRDQVKLAEVRLKYGISPTIVLRVPEHKERVVCPKGDEIAFFEDALHAGARFSLTREMRQLLCKRLALTNEEGEEVSRHPLIRKGKKRARRSLEQRAC